MECIVEFDYDAEQKDEISLRQNDIVKNVRKFPGDGWWEGEVNGKRGFFPNNFVKERKEKAPAPPAISDRPKFEKKPSGGGGQVAELASKIQGIKMGPPPIHQKGFKRDGSTKRVKQRVRVTYDYQAEKDDEISIHVGDIIDLLKQEEEGWWEGELNGQRGMFPSNFVEPIQEGGTSEEEKEDNEEKEIKGKKVVGVGLGDIFGNQGPIKLRPTAKHNHEPTPAKEEKKLPTKEEKKLPVKPPSLTSAPELPPAREKETTMKERAVVEHAYHANNEDELSIDVGDMVIILDKNTEDEGWWKGEFNGKVGMFPNNFVKLIPPGEGSNNNTQEKPKKPPPPTTNKVTVTKPGMVPSGPSAAPRPVSVEAKPTPGSLKKHQPPVIGKSHSMDNTDHKPPTELPLKIPPPTPDKQQKPHLPTPTGNGDSISSNAQIDELKKEISNLKKNTVLRQEYENVQQELQALKQEVQNMKSEFNDKLAALMDEIDDEKKNHLSTKVEIDRVRRLVGSK